MGISVIPTKSVCPGPFSAHQNPRDWVIHKVDQFVSCNSGHRGIQLSSKHWGAAFCHPWWKERGQQGPEPLCTSLLVWLLSTTRKVDIDWLMSVGGPGVHATSCQPPLLTRVALETCVQHVTFRDISRQVWWNELLPSLYSHLSPFFKHTHMQAQIQSHVNIKYLIINLSNDLNEFHEVQVGAYHGRMSNVLAN